MSFVELIGIRSIARDGSYAYTIEVRQMGETVTLPCYGEDFMRVGIERLAAVMADAVTIPVRVSYIGF